MLGMFEVLDGAPSGTGAQSSGLDTMVTNLGSSPNPSTRPSSNSSSGRRSATLSTMATSSADAAVEQEQEGKKLLQRLEDGAPGDADYQQALQEFVKAAASTSCTSRTWCGRGSSP